MPDAATLVMFLRLLEPHDLCKALYTAINVDFAARGLLLRAGTLVVKNLIRHRQTRYRGLARTGHPIHTLFGLTNGVIAARRAAA
ncbi:MAG: hypothetical protein RLZZ15_2448 [Verrucomicrobiota bacterium]